MRNARAISEMQKSQPISPAFLHSPFSSVSLLSLSISSVIFPSKWMSSVSNQSILFSLFSFLFLLCLLQIFMLECASSQPRKRPDLQLDVIFGKGMGLGVVESRWCLVRKEK